MVYMRKQIASKESKEASTGFSSGGSTGNGAILTVGSTTVSSIEEATRLLNTSTPVRLPTIVSSSMA